MIFFKNIENELKFTLEKNENIAVIDRDKLAEEMKNNEINNINEYQSDRDFQLQNLNKGDIHE